MRRRNLSIRIYERKYEIGNISVSGKEIMIKNKELRRIDRLRRINRVNIRKLNSDRSFLLDYIRYIRFSLV